MWNRLVSAFKGAFSLDSVVTFSVHALLVAGAGIVVPGLTGLFAASIPAWSFVAIGVGSALLMVAYLMARWDRKHRPSDLDGLTGPDGIAIFTSEDQELRFPTAGPE